MPHSPVSSPVFNTLHEGIDLAFGDFCFHANREGMLRFPNSPTTAKTRSASTTSSSSSDSDSDSDSKTSDSSIYREEDDFHSIESEEPMEFD